MWADRLSAPLVVCRLEGLEVGREIWDHESFNESEQGYSPVDRDLYTADWLLEIKIALPLRVNFNLISFRGLIFTAVLAVNLQSPV